MSKQVDFRKNPRDKEAVWLSRRKGRVPNADILRGLLDDDKEYIDR